MRTQEIQNVGVTRKKPSESGMYTAHWDNIFIMPHNIKTMKTNTIISFPTSKIQSLPGPYSQGGLGGPQTLAWTKGSKGYSTKVHIFPK